MPAGRPDKYKTEFDVLAQKHCFLGATDADLADLFNVTDRTIRSWYRKHASFRAAVTNGKREADANVASRLYQRAMGYQHTVVKTAFHKGQWISTEVVEKLPPDVTAQIIWLKNRQPELWRDRPEPRDNGLSDEQRVERLKAMMGAMRDTVLLGKGAPAKTVSDGETDE